MCDSQECNLEDLFFRQCVQKIRKYTISTPIKRGDELESMKKSTVEFLDILEDWAEEEKLIDDDINNKVNEKLHFIECFVIKILERDYGPELAATGNEALRLIWHMKRLLLEKEKIHVMVVGCSKPNPKKIS